MGHKAHRGQTGETEKVTDGTWIPTGHCEETSCTSQHSLHLLLCLLSLCQSPGPPQRAERRRPGCLFLPWGTVSCKPSSSSVKPPSSTEPINPFSFPLLSSVDSSQCSSGLLITARHEADGSAFIDTITARSSSLHCLQACLYLSPNPFCHFWPSSHYFIFFHIKLNKPLVSLHISYRIQLFFCDLNECLMEKKLHRPVPGIYSLS